MAASFPNITKPDPDSPVPLYHQVETDLRRLIDAGEFVVGDSLPPETKLGRRYGVSRHTMRRALQQLVQDDLISRSAGRGTTVKAKPDRATFYLDRSFTRQMADMGRTACSEVLQCALGRIEATALGPLASRAGEPCVRLVRLRFGNDEPIGLQRAVVLTACCPDLASHDFSQRSLYSVLSSEYQLMIGEIRHAVSAVRANERQSERLKVALGDPLLLVRTAAFLDKGSLVEHTTSFYRSDRYEYRTAHTL